MTICKSCAVTHQRLSSLYKLPLNYFIFTNYFLKHHRTTGHLHSRRTKNGKIKKQLIMSTFVNFVKCPLNYIFLLSKNDFTTQGLKTAAAMLLKMKGGNNDDHIWLAGITTKLSIRIFIYKFTIV